jgi:hypothetical protein
MVTCIEESVREEFSAAELGDRRRTARLVRVAEAIDRDPNVGFPRSLESEAELEGFYRLINNDGFEAADIVAPHLEATRQRATEAGVVLVIHDTTVVDYTGRSLREGLGITTGNNTQGFLAHASLVLSEQDGVPLGLAHLETLTRSGKKRRSRKDTTRVMRSDAQRESLRWLRGIQETERMRDGKYEAIHITDAEGDFFELLASLHQQGSRFVIRAGQLDRVVRCDQAELSLREAISDIRASAKRAVAVSARSHLDNNRALRKAKARRHPNRSERIAQVAIGTRRVVLSKTRYSDRACAPFEVTVVRVWEPHQVPGEPAVEWVLFTSEKVSSRAAIERVVDLYRRRWTIEEYFKALKTGCALEKRQVESYDALCKMLAILAPIAYRLLLFRALARAAPTAPATRAFSPVELAIMKAAPSNKALPPPKSIADALAHLARLGGHLKRNGPPGWVTLGRGYERLLALRLGWRMAEESRRRCDQS